jgi:hypothetical protein
MKTGKEPTWPPIRKHWDVSLGGMIDSGRMYLSIPAWRLLAAPFLILAVPLWPLVLAVLWVEFCSLNLNPPDSQPDLGTLRKVLQRHRRGSMRFPPV